MQLRRLCCSKGGLLVACRHIFYDFLSFVEGVVIRWGASNLLLRPKAAESPSNPPRHMIESECDLIEAGDISEVLFISGTLSLMWGLQISAR